MRSFAAVADAGVEWSDVSSPTGGSWTVANPDAIVGMVGLTGIPVHHGSTRARRRPVPHIACADGIRLGDYDIGIAVGLDKHPRARSEDPAFGGHAVLVRRERAIPHHEFFGMKANRYLHDHGVSQETLAKGGRQELPQRRTDPEWFRA